MQRRVPVQELRGSDTTLLEVQLPNLLRRPLGQLAPENALDLLALSESEAPPKAVTRQLEQFVERAHREIQDMPGAQLSAYLDELKEVPAARVPQTLRTWVAAEIGRPDREDGRIQQSVDAWAEVDPTPFPVGDRAAKVQRAAAGPRPKNPLSKATAGPARGAAKEKAPRKAKAKAAPKLELRGNNPEKDEVIRRLCMERLNGATSEKGLSEMVLIAGVRHRAKTDGFDDVTPAEVTAVLRGLKTIERVRYSAGRWMSTARRW